MSVYITARAFYQQAFSQASLQSSNRAHGQTDATECITNYHAATRVVINIDFLTGDLHLAVTCPVDTSLNKNPPPNGPAANFPVILSSSCVEGERFDDGLGHEELKCAAVRRIGVWNHPQYSCSGDYPTFHIYRVGQKVSPTA